MGWDALAMLMLTSFSLWGFPLQLLQIHVLLLLLGILLQLRQPKWKNFPFRQSLLWHSRSLSPDFGLELQILIWCILLCCIPGFSTFLEFWQETTGRTIPHLWNLITYSQTWPVKLYQRALGVGAGDGFLFSSFSAITNGIVLCTNGPKLQGEYKSSKTWSVLVVLIATGRNQDISSHGKILVDCLYWMQRQQSHSTSA